MKKLIGCVFYALIFSITACASPHKTEEKTPESSAPTSQSKQRNDAIDHKPLKLTPHRVALFNGTTLTLYAPKDFEIVHALDGLKRPRFFAKSPDNRIFLTSM